jgi:hypothetical protein
MKAELIILGKRLDMAPRANRQIMVVLIYAGLACLMAGFWMLDRWRVTGVYMIFATILINRLLLGGYNFGGLIKPFKGKAPRVLFLAPPFLVLGLRLYKPEPEESDYRNDERELQQRDHAHYQAYQALAILLVIVWFICNLKLGMPRLMSFIPVAADTLLYGLTLAAIMVSQTLPQAILLWSEPDMAEDTPEE